VEVVASLCQGRTAAAQCGLFTYKSVPVIFEPPCRTYGTKSLTGSEAARIHTVRWNEDTTSHVVVERLARTELRKAPSIEWKQLNI